MRLLLTSAGISQHEHPRRAGRPAGQTDRRVQRPLHSDRDLPLPRRAGMAWQAICGKAQRPLCELGWKSLGVLELTALPSIRGAGCQRSGRPTPCWYGAAIPCSSPLDAALRLDRPLAGAAPRGRSTWA